MLDGDLADTGFGVCVGEPEQRAATKRAAVRLPGHPGVTTGFGVNASSVGVVALTALE